MLKCTKCILFMFCLCLQPVFIYFYSDSCVIFPNITGLMLMTNKANQRKEKHSLRTPLSRRRLSVPPTVGGFSSKAGDEGFITLCLKMLLNDQLSY